MQRLTENYMRSLIACSAVVLSAAFSTAKAQDLQRDILAGHITGPSGPVAGAMVSVTQVDATAGAAPLIARTDIEGRWLVAVQEGSGNYVVRVTASDERSEPRDRALETSFTSSAILVDNRKPEVVGLVAKLPYVSGRARDDQSPLSAMEYAVDGGDWQVLAPNDGIADDVVEAFTIKLPPLPPGPHAITVRVWDSADNVGAAGVTIRSAK